MLSLDFPRVTYDGSRLTVFKTHNRDHVYVAELKAKSTRLGLPMRLTMSDSLDYPDAWTRDSSAVLFESNRTGENPNFQAATATGHRRTPNPGTG